MAQAFDRGRFRHLVPGEVQFGDGKRLRVKRQYLAGPGARRVKAGIDPLGIGIAAGADPQAAGVVLGDRQDVVVAEGRPSSLANGIATPVISHIP